MQTYFKYLILITLMWSCNNSTSSKKIIVSTTSIAGDIVEHILPPGYVLMGPGVDPHLYKSKSGDHTLLNKADVIVYSGLHLEGKMTDALNSLSQTKTVINLSNGIDPKNLITSVDFGGSFDPHFWFDIDLFMESVKHCSKLLMLKFPNDSVAIKTNTTKYLLELDSTQKYLAQKVSELPKEKRVLITAHDAFSYFGKKYNFTVKGIQGASTASEAGLKDITLLVDYIIEHKVRSIFVESSVSERNINAIIEGCKSKNYPIKLGGTLYSDALGDKKSGAGTYSGMTKHNINVICNALNQ